MTFTENLRLKAEKCRRLGAGQDPKTILALSAMADEYDAAALAFDMAAATSAKPLGSQF